jgi:hypothetical protein
MPARLKVCFNGCSITKGEGFPVEQRDNTIYDRIVTRQFDLEATNISQGGSSNYTIFMRSAWAVMSGLYDVVCTQWSALNRLWLSPGPDCVFFTNDNRQPDFHYRDIYLSNSDKQKFKDTILLLNHDYQNILDLLDYCGILSTLAQHTNTQVVFINGLVPWQSDLVQPLTTDLTNSLSDYTKSILEFDYRSDEEIIKFAQKLQDKFKQADITLWVNLFDSFFKNIVDYGPEGHHPGVQSHQWMATQLANHITKRKII